MSKVIRTITKDGQKFDVVIINGKEVHLPCGKTGLGAKGSIYNDQDEYAFPLTEEEKRIWVDQFNNEILANDHGKENSLFRSIDGYNDIHPEMTNSRGEPITLRQGLNRITNMRNNDVLTEAQVLKSVDTKISFNQDKEDHDILDTIASLPVEMSLSTRIEELLSVIAPTDLLELFKLEAKTNIEDGLDLDDELEWLCNAAMLISLKAINNNKVKKIKSKVKKKIKNIVKKAKRKSKK